MMDPDDDPRVLKEPRRFVPTLHDYGDQLPGHKYPPGMWSSRVASDMMFERRLQRLVRLREADAAYRQAQRDADARKGG